MGAQKAWVISVDMGYGHQRAAYPLKDIAYEHIITANSDKIVTPKEQRMFRRFRFVYESLSRLRSIPIIGEFLWRFMRSLQNISPYYPFRDQSKPNFGSIYMHKLIRKGFLRSIVEYTRKKDIPFISTIFAPSVAAAHAGRKNVYIVVTDTDISRVWVPEDPKSEKIYYLTPTDESTHRIASYGVPKERIFFTGFPLPKENMGKDLEILKLDLGERICKLDPKNKFRTRYFDLVSKQLGTCRVKRKRPLTLMLAIGGAGAQKEIGATIIRSLRNRIRKHKIRIYISAGTRPEIERYFKSVVKEVGLSRELGKHIQIMCALKKKDHFKMFNELLHTTDILWTKPSELSFFVALGIPIIIAPPLGVHEHFNKKWLVRMGSGITQEDPRYVNDWLFDWVDKGLLAEAAWQGFTEAPRFGTYNIEKLIASKDKRKVKFRY